MDQPTPRVFISYSHDSEEHKHRVRRLADRLRGDGLDCRLDQYLESPPQGWPAWMDDQVQAADFVLVISTAGYRDKASVRSPSTSGRGTRFESVLIMQDLYEAGMWNERFIPVLFDQAFAETILRPLRPYTYYRADTPEGYDALYRRLTSQPRIVAPSIGPLQELPPEASPGETAAPHRATSEPNESPQSPTRQAPAPPQGRTNRLSGRTNRLGTVGLVLAVPLALLGIAARILDLPGRWATFRQHTSPESQQLQPLSGRLRDAETGLPLRGVWVQLPEYGEQTDTDELGVFRFELAVAAETQVRVSAFLPGYELLERETSVGPGQDVWRMRRAERTGIYQSTPGRP